MNEVLKKHLKKEAIDLIHTEMNRYKKTCSKNLLIKVNIELDGFDYEESLNLYHTYVKFSCELIEVSSDDENKATYGLIKAIYSVGLQFDSNLEKLENKDNGKFITELMIEYVEPKAFDFFNSCFKLMELPMMDFSRLKED